MTGRASQVSSTRRSEGIQNEILDQLRQFDEEITAKHREGPTVDSATGLYHVTCSRRVPSIVDTGLQGDSGSLVLEQVRQEPSEVTVRQHRIHTITERVLESVRTSLPEVTAPPRRETNSFWPTLEATVEYIEEHHPCPSSISVLRIEPAELNTPQSAIADYQSVVDLRNQIADFAMETDLETLAFLVDSMGIPPAFQRTAEDYWVSHTDLDTDSDELQDRINSTCQLPELRTTQTVPWPDFTCAISTRSPQQIDSA